MVGDSPVNFNRIYDRLSYIQTSPLQEQFVTLLQKTWRDISVDYCHGILKRKRPNESISPNDVVRVELLPDEVRCAAYSHMNKWNGTTEQYVLDEWFDLPIEAQNILLIEAFPDGEVYGV